jgi:hypothetical protein
LLEHSYADEAGPFATLLEPVTLFHAAPPPPSPTCRNTLNLIGACSPKPGGSAPYPELLQRRLLSFGLVVATGFLLCSCRSS